MSRHQLPDYVSDFLLELRHGKAAQDAVLTHLQRELFQACWAALLGDPEFCDAYVNGIVIKCNDGITRRFFLCFFAYSADYPEKTVNARISCSQL